MADLNLKIDEKCVHCGKCIKDCTGKVLEFDENNVPQAVHSERCIKCQHCLAICPVGALSILDKSPENSEKVLEHDPEMVLNLIKSRRSVRFYNKENLPPETMQKLKDMLAWVPTGINNHNLHFSFVDDIEVMDDIRDYIYEKLKNAFQAPVINTDFKMFAASKNAILKGEDVVFRGAPHMLVVSAPVNSPCKDVDPIIALSYFELYAQSLGVGTLWCGCGYAMFRLFPELCKQIEVPENYNPSYVMLFGPTHAKYPRTTQPEQFSIISVKRRQP